MKEYLYDLDDVTKKLELKGGDRLLNIGCGNCLMELILNYWVSEIDCIDFTEGMIERARRNNATNKNVSLYIGNILDLSFLNKSYDKILCNSVIQYLNDLTEVATALKEINRVSKKKVKILIAANPNRSKLEEFLNGYDRLDMNEKDREKKKKATRLSLWTDPEKVAKIAEDIGFKAETLKMNPNVWQSWYMYDLLLWR